MRRIVVLAACILAVRAGLSIAQLGIEVRDMAGLGSLRPVTGGVPLAEGTAGDGMEFALYDENGRPVACQTSVLARWKDRSARWVLLDFQAQPPANGKSRFTLRWGKETQTVDPEFPVQISGRKEPSAHTKNIVLSPVENALLQISDRLQLRFSLTDGEGRDCSGVVESVEVQTEGRLRSTLALDGAFRRPDGGRVFGFRMLASVFAGLSKVCLEPQILVDSQEGVIQNIRSLKLEATALDRMRLASIGGLPGWLGKPTSPVLT